MSDLIPDKAFMVAATALWGTPAGDATRVARTAVEAAAPIIAQHARVAILRKVAETIEGWSRDEDRWSRLPGTDFEGREACEGRAAAFENVAEYLRDKATELEGKPGP